MLPVHQVHSGCLGPARQVELGPGCMRLPSSGTPGCAVALRIVPAQDPKTHCQQIPQTSTIQGDFTKTPLQLGLKMLHKSTSICLTERFVFAYTYVSSMGPTEQAPHPFSSYMHFGSSNKGLIGQNHNLNQFGHSIGRRRISFFVFSFPNSTLGNNLVLGPHRT